MKYLFCNEEKITSGWTYDFWAADGYIVDAIRMSIDEMLMFVGIVARQTKADVTFTHGAKMYSWYNGLQLS